MSVNQQRPLFDFVNPMGNNLLNVDGVKQAQFYLQRTPAMSFEVQRGLQPIFSSKIPIPTTPMNPRQPIKNKAYSGYQPTQLKYIKTPTTIFKMPQMLIPQTIREGQNAVFSDGVPKLNTTGQSAVYDNLVKEGYRKQILDLRSRGRDDEADALEQRYFPEQHQIALLQDQLAELGALGGAQSRLHISNIGHAKNAAMQRQAILDELAALRASGIVSGATGVPAPSGIPTGKAPAPAPTGKAPSPAPTGKAPAPTGKAPAPPAPAPMSPPPVYTPSSPSIYASPAIPRIPPPSGVDPTKITAPPSSSSYSGNPKEYDSFFGQLLGSILSNELPTEFKYDTASYNKIGSIKSVIDEFNKSKLSSKDKEYKSVLDNINERVNEFFVEYYPVISKSKDVRQSFLELMIVRDMLQNNIAPKDIDYNKIISLTNSLYAPPRPGTKPSRTVETVKTSSDINKVSTSLKRLVDDAIKNGRL